MGKATTSAVLKRAAHLVDNPHLWPEKDQKFARCMLQHNDAKRALMESGLIADMPGGWTQKGFAAAILALPHIAGLIDERRQAALHTISEHSVIAEVAKIAFFNPAKLMVIQDDGSAYVDLTNMEAADGAAIREITSEVYQDFSEGRDAPRNVKRTTIKVEPKTPALQLLGRYLGVLDADNNVNVNLNLGDGSRIVEARRKARLAATQTRTIEHRKAG